MEAVAAIFEDKELMRVLTHLGLPADFPILAPARSPPGVNREGSQADPNEALYEGIDWVPPEENIVASSEDMQGA